MSLVTSNQDSRPAWRFGFGLLVAVPALVLAVLGMRAVRAERLEREQERRDREAQTAQLADAGIRGALSEIERAVDDRKYAGVHFFTFDRPGRLEFSRDRLYFDDSPQTDRIAWPARVEDLVEAARTAEVQQRRDEAAAAFKRIIAIEPRLRHWAQLSLWRAESKDDRPFLNNLDEDALAPSGLPLALVAAASVPAKERERYAALIERTRSALRSGKWWLSFEERRFYDEVLANPGADAHLQELAAVSRLVPDAPLRRDETTRYWGRGMLLLLSPSPQSATLWHGAALGPQALDLLLNRVMRPVGGKVRILDASGQVVWGAPFDNAAGRAQPLSVVPGWKLVFESTAVPGWLDRRTMLWLGFIALLIVTMLASLASTMRIIRREAELARLQNEFIAGVSHDFKSPITGVRLLLERMAGGRVTSPDAAARYQAAAERELARLERHVNRLLEAQQIQAGQRGYVFEPASLTEIVSDAVAELTTEAEARQMVVQREHCEVPMLRLDRAAMTGAVANLVGNAIKYSSPGGRIHIKTGVDSDYAFIEVEDEGVGIDADDMGKVFQRFYRGKHRNGVNGTGLGLALVKTTVQAHGGQVSATSAPGKGSRFTIRLPLRDLVIPSAAEREESGRGDRAPTQIPRRLRGSE